MLIPGEPVGDLVRGYGNNHRFRIEWTPGEAPKDYVVSFNMNACTLSVDLGDGSDDDAVDEIRGSVSSDGAYYDLYGRKWQTESVKRSGLPKGIYIRDGKKIMK
jgi:hypothetical protein